MKNLIYLFFTLCLLLVVSCDDDDNGSSTPGTVTELYFGTFRGQCGGNCTTIYWVRDQELRTDTINDIYAGLPTLGDLDAYPLLSDSLYQFTTEIRAAFPNQLYNEEPVIGIPDAYDQGGYFIAVPSGDGYREWRIDTNFDDVPDELEPFLNQVFDLMVILNE